MRVLITGGSGTLGRALVPVLVSERHVPVILDIDPAQDVPAETVRADITRPDEIARAMKGIDVVVHGAAWHGIHLASHSAHEFFELNVRGTFNVWEAAAEAKVRAFIFSSTMGVYGESRRPASEEDVVRVHEELPLLPGDVYGYSKLVGEEMCRYHLRANAIPSIALRYGMFVPEPFFRYGIRLLYGGVHEDDVAGAVIAAMNALLEGRVMFDVFNVESALPFEAGDARDLRRDPLVVVERHYPGAAELLRSRGVRSLKPVTEWFAMDRIADRLGFRPRHDFREWLEELRRRPNERADSDPPWP